MTILDYWGNSLNGNVGVLYGYRGVFEEFPHDIYSFYLSTIRESDQADVALLYRWLKPMQDFWEAQYNTILGVSSLLSPEECPVQYLDYLRKNVGIDDSLSYIWGTMSEGERRRFIKYFVRFLKYRTTDYGIDEMMETMSGTPVILRDYFYYRWLLSGDVASSMETAIGREDDGYDPWLLSDYEIPLAIRPDSILLITNPVSGDDYYQFNINTLVASIVEFPMPETVFVRNIVTGDTYIGNVRYDGTDYTVNTPDNYTFEQSVYDLSTDTDRFFVSFEPDQYVSDILIVDDGTLNRDMIRALAKFSRPISERFYIRYYKLLEQFNNLDLWTKISGQLTLNDISSVYLGHSVANSVMQLDYVDSASWEDYCVTVKCNNRTYEKYGEIRFMYQDSNNYYYFRFTSHEPPTWIQGDWILGRVIGGVNVVLDTGSVENLDRVINYIWRIESSVVSIGGIDSNMIRVYQDENILTQFLDSPLPWASSYGTIQIVSESNGRVEVINVSVHSLPMESDYVGPSV